MTVADKGVPAIPGLRANLGLPSWFVQPLVKRGSFVRLGIEALSMAFLPLEIVVFAALALVPDRLKNVVVVMLFHFWVRLHRLLPGRWVRRGISDTLSIEAHAITNFMWWGRLLPVSVLRARFGLSTVAWNYPLAADVLQEVVAEDGVNGYFLKCTPATSKETPVLLWLFAGAFVGGSAKDNRGIAAHYARKTGCDVFVASYRLAPEHTVDDALQDACRAYQWLLRRVEASRIVVCGISSGGGLALSLLQLAARPPQEGRSYFLPDADGSVKPLPQPAGAVLMGPFVFWGSPSETASSRVLCPVDLVVTERVVELLEQHLPPAVGGEERAAEASPINRSMQGLCPMVINFSEHEVCVDDCRELAKRLQAAGVEVDTITTPFLWHAFQMMSCFIPEAQGVEDATVAWIKQRFA